MNAASQDRPILSFKGGTLVLEGVEQAALATVFGPSPWLWDRRIAAWRADAMEYSQVCRKLDEAGIDFADRVPAWEPVRWPRVTLRRPRPEQQSAQAAWNLGRRGVLVMPTGTGKTEVALAIMAEAAVSTLVVVPVRDLMYQWHRRIAEGLGYDAGIIGDNLFRVRPISVTTYDSACIHMEQFGNRFALVVFDECHHLPGPVRRDAARMSAAPMRLGLTATPQRSDGRHVDLDTLIGPIVYQVSLPELAGKTLAPYEVVRIPVHLSPDEQARYDRLSREVRRYIAEQRKTDPKYSWKDLCSATGKAPEARRAMKAYYAKRSIEDRADEKLRVLEDLFRLHAGEPCLVFAGSNAMARDVSRRFLIPCLLNHCGKRERLEVLHGLAAGEYPALVANQVLDEGVARGQGRHRHRRHGLEPAGQTAARPGASQDGQCQGRAVRNRLRPHQRRAPLAPPPHQRRLPAGASPQAKIARGSPLGPTRS
ncbi:MAG: DEAD/DEAH box helicase family protein [Thermoguttaceae bacterium]|nr:DEAD/DEAH box helicase family protein [Thermoguttaceae bacterium]